MSEFKITGPVKTLRDEYAMAALQGILANCGCHGYDTLEQAADAYTYADAMLAARQKGGAV